MMRTIGIIAITFCSFFLLVIATTPRNETPITSLPGLTFTPNFEQYSGYITLQGTTKNIFYWFVTSQNNPSTDPLVLWLQGGPGCSDFGGGMFLENGPFYPSADYSSKNVSLVYNPYTWNQIANVVYIDQPCGVGFSYGEKPSDYKTNDNQTAIDNYLFLQGFFDVFPEYSTNTLWITGESYAGIYITTLAYQILNNASDPSLTSSLMKGGLMLGNPVTNCEGISYTGEGDVLLLNNRVNIYYWHGMVSRRAYDNWNSNNCSSQHPSNLAKCFELFTSIEQGVGNLNQPTKSKMEMMERSNEEMRLMNQRRRSTSEKRQRDGAVNPDMLYYSYCTGNGTLDFNTAIVPDCFTLDDQIVTYLNQPSVQSAIHAQPTKWGECGGVLYHQNVGSVIPYLSNFFSVAPSMKILYYSGDCDFATVPFPQTQRCLETLNRPITEHWRPYTINKEVAGYVEVYDTYTYATIKGAGHEAPEYQPAAGWLLFSSFINGKSLPK